MKKFRWFLFLSFAFLIVWVKPLPVYAADDGYYIKNMNVDVKVNDKRQYIITEKIDAYFNEERHGIIRKIPTIGSAEDCTVTDISVGGAPYTVQNGSTVQIKIGDKDEKIKGDKSYIIKYTLNHYDDEEADADYLYLNVLGDQWDTRVEKFSSIITYPSHMTLNDYTITSGDYGSKENSLGVKTSVNGNKISINSNSEIGEHNSITINAKFNNGDFSEVPKFNYGYIIRNQETNIDITNQQEYLVTQTFDIKINNTTDMCAIPVLNGYKDRSQVYDFKSSNDKIEYLEGSNIFLPKEMGVYVFTVSYKIKPPLYSDLSFYICSAGSTGKIEKVKAVIKSPVPIKEYNVQTDADCNLQQTGNTISINNKKPLKRYASIKVNIDADKKAFTRPMPRQAITMLICAVLSFLLSLAAFFVFGRDEKLYHIVEFYPPDGMSSAEAAYVMNGGCNNTDITSLIYYWASHNHLKIVMKYTGKKKKANGFKLEKISDLDNNHQKYEVDLFNSIFSKGRGNSVSSSTLKDKIYVDVNRAARNVKKVFTGERRLYDQKSSVMRFICFILSYVPLIPLIMSRTAETGNDGGDIFFIALLSGFALLIFYGITCKFNDSYKMSNGGKVGWTIFAGIMYCIIFGIFIEYYKYDLIPFKLVFLTVLFMFASFFVTAFVSKKSKYNVDISSRLMGFKDFMKTAEKERLETLIDDDPEYFYNTLPYAQVLGVTEVWKDKFREITMEPPSWYDGGFDTFDYLVLNSLVDNMNTVSSDMMSMPSSSDSGGGFDGGGFSGGGSGGGGGSSW